MNEQDIGQRIRKFRTQQGKTLAEIAGAADLTKSTLSKIERGEVSPPVSTLFRIVGALSIPIDDLFTSERKRKPYTVTRKAAGAMVARPGSSAGYTYEALGADKMDKAMEPFILTQHPDDEAQEFTHDGEELIYVITGRVDFHVGSDHIALNAGDAIYFDATYPHGARVKGKRPAKCLCVFSPHPGT